MPSMRRMKVFSLLIFVGVITLLFYTASLRQQRTQDLRTMSDFYTNTMNALGKSPTTGSVSGSDDEDVAKAMQQRLKDAAQLAKDNANSKSPKPDPPSAVIGKGSAAEGAGQERGIAGRKKYGADAQEPVKEETQEDHEVEKELNSILKKSPIIIFSKSYCPHSRRAKGILLEKYIINPSPFVVELDKHPLGSKLQNRLAELTSRRTVPNVLINGVSIGGGDDVVDLDNRKALVEKVHDLGGKRMLDVRLRPVEEKVEKKKEEIVHGLR
ncbi:hypothetical protein B7494_g3330 [Chlorociboria aeruginascens]|nr:hypothetical protein B7494_g3330 [Chlorociboria aeruginascens]